MLADARNNTSNPNDKTRLEKWEIFINLLDEERQNYKQELIIESLKKLGQDPLQMKWITTETKGLQRPREERQVLLHPWHLSEQHMKQWQARNAHWYEASTS